MMLFSVDGDPEAQARPRTFSMRGRIVTHSPKMAWYGAVALMAKTNRPAAPLDGPVLVGLDFRFRRPASIKMDVSFKSTKPDNDNLEKSVFDAMASVGWFKDSRIALNVTQKRYAEAHEKPGLTVMVVALLETHRTVDMASLCHAIEARA